MIFVVSLWFGNTSKVWIHCLAALIGAALTSQVGSVCLALGRCICTGSDLGIYCLDPTWAPPIPALFSVLMDDLLRKQILELTVPYPVASLGLKGHFICFLQNQDADPLCWLVHMGASIWIRHMTSGSKVLDSSKAFSVDAVICPLNCFAYFKKATFLSHFEARKFHCQWFRHSDLFWNITAI